MFIHNEYTVAYGLKAAKFIIVDESYAHGAAMADINRMVCVIKLFDEVGTLVSESFGCLVVGLGDDKIAVTSDDTSILGKVLSNTNMDKCVVELYE
jgi:hypothetical protein